MEKKSSRPWQLLGKYFSELIVIILGITLSFLFDEWRQDRQDRRAEHEYLLALRNDLRMDSAMLDINLRIGENFLHATERLAYFSKPSDIADSLHLLVDAAASYVAFSPTAATYEELRQTGRTALLRDDTLRRTILALHNNVYAGEREISTVDKGHVVSQLIPILSEHFPLTTDSMVMAASHRHIAQLQQPRLRNSLITAAAFKHAVQQSHELCNTYCSFLLKRIDRLLDGAAKQHE